MRFGPKTTRTEKYISGPFGPAGADPGGGGTFFFRFPFRVHVHPLGYIIPTYNSFHRIRLLNIHIYLFIEHRLSP